MRIREAFLIELLTPLTQEAPLGKSCGTNMRNILCPVQKLHQPNGANTLLGRAYFLETQRPLWELDRPFLKSPSHHWHWVYLINVPSARVTTQVPFNLLSNGSFKWEFHLRSTLKRNPHASQWEFVHRRFTTTPVAAKVTDKVKPCSLPSISLASPGFTKTLKDASKFQTTPGISLLLQEKIECYREPSKLADGMEKHH